jgi:hypothetical protein
MQLSPAPLSTFLFTIFSFVKIFGKIEKDSIRLGYIIEMAHQNPRNWILGGGNSAWDIGYTLNACWDNEVTYEGKI